MADYQPTHAEIDEDVFRWFDYKVVVRIADFLCHIQRNAFDKFTTAWWKNLIKELGNIILIDKAASEALQQKILDRVVAELPKNFLNEAQIQELKKELAAAYAGFIFIIIGPISNSS